MANVVDYSKSPKTIRSDRLANPYSRMFTNQKADESMAGKVKARRNSVATYIDNHGILKYKGGNQATNILTYSEDFANSIWTKSSVTVLSNVAEAPDGTMTADKIVENATSANHYVANNGVDTFGQSYYTFSIFLKSAGRRYARIAMRNTTYGTTSNISLYVDLLSYKVDSFTNCRADVEYVGNGWCRCSITNFALSTTTGEGQVYVYTSTKTNSNYLGDGESGIYVWGAQHESSNAANGYIRTTNTKVTTSRFSDRFVSPLRKEREGYLFEDASENLFLKSEQFDNPEWIKIGSTVSTNAEISPNGQQTAERLTEDTSTGRHGIDQAVAFNSGFYYTLSGFVKPESRKAIDIFGLCSFLLEGKGSVISNRSDVYAEIKRIGDGWYRVSMTVMASTNSVVSVGFSICQDDGTRSYTGDGSGSLLIFGAQVERYPWPTSYIYTSTSTVIRAKDVTTVSIANIPPPYRPNTQPFTVLCKYDFFGDPSINSARLRNIFDAESTTGQREYNALVEASNNLLFRIGDNTGQDVRATSGNTYLAYTIDEDDNIKMYDNGTLSDTNTYNDEARLSYGRELFIGCDEGGNAQLFGHISDLRFYNFALNGAEIKELYGEK